MSLFTINNTKCKRDGICAEECPMGIIVFRGGDALPSPVPGADKLCINCGHCVAVCPHGAFSLEVMNTEDCLPVQSELLPGPEQVKHFLASRRSIRTYKKQPVERAVLAKLIDTARYAPSGHNMQPVHWMVIEDPNEVKGLSALVVDWMRFVIKERPEFAQALHMDRVVGSWEKGEDRITRGAPHVVVAYGLENLPIAQSACTIALTYLELATYSLGLGACWAGYFSVAAAFYPPMAQALALPEGHQCYGAMMIGYPKHRYHRVPTRKEPAVTWR